MVSNSEWIFSGHGKTTGSYEVTGRAAANFPGAAGTGDPCLYCHDSTVPHNDANYFRLRQNNKADLNGVCLGCHETGAAGVNPGAGYSLKNALLVKVNKDHQGAKHGVNNDGGRWCWDCHDPHGDASGNGARIQMIQRRAQVNPNLSGVPTGPTTFLTGTDIVFTVRTGSGIGAGAFARDAVPYAEGICNACHTSPNVSQYTATTGKGSHSTSVCTSCHQHNPENNDYDGNAFKGSGCNGCHGNATGQYWPDGTGASYANDNANSAARHNTHIAAISQYRWGLTLVQLKADPATDTKQKEVCAFCHPSPAGAPGHDDNIAPLGTVDVLGAGQFLKFNGAQATATDTGSGAYSGGTTRSCSNLACHNRVTTPTAALDSWEGTTAANCTILCHLPNSDASARQGHKKHVNGKGYACTECHVDNGSNYGHINGEVNLLFSNPGSMEQTYGALPTLGSYSQAANSAPFSGVFGNCGNMYCHADKQSPDWNIIPVTGCTDCHTAGGSALFNPTSGLHNGVAPTVSGVKHDETLSGGCAACHTVAPSALTSMASSPGRQRATTAPRWGCLGAYAHGGPNNTGTCANTACHLGGASRSDDWAHVWTNAPSYYTTTLSCGGCHGVWLNNGTTWTAGVTHVTTADDPDQARHRRHLRL